jgi:hypothetical protein
MDAGAFFQSVYLAEFACFMSLRKSMPHRNFFLNVIPVLIRFNNGKERYDGLHLWIIRV